MSEAGPEWAVDRVEGLDAATFVRDYVARSRPAVLRGAAAGWKLMGWTLERLSSRHGQAPVTWQRWDAAAPLSWPETQSFVEGTLGDFASQVKSLAERKVEGTYCFDFAVTRRIPELRGEIDREDLERYQGVAHYPRPLRRQWQGPTLLWMGPPGPLSALHFDLQQQIFIQVEGRMRWLLFDFAERARLGWPAPELGPRLSQTSPFNPEAPDRFPQIQDVPRADIILEPGDLLFFPTGVWHQARMLDPGVSVAISWFDPVRTPRPYLSWGGAQLRRLVPGRRR